MYDAHTINSYFHVDFCEHDACTILIPTVGLTQAHPIVQIHDHILSYNHELNRIKCIATNLITERCVYL